MSAPGQRTLRQLIQAELRSVPVSPPPAAGIVQRGEMVRTRRRAAGGVMAVAAAVAAWGLTAFIHPPAPAGRPAPVVIVNAVRPPIVGGVFAAGTAGGRPWQLAVRNIATAPHACLPAVMLNSRDGDLLLRPAPGAPAIRNPAFLTGVPGFPGVVFGFTQLDPAVTGFAVDLSGHRLAQPPVTAPLCGQRFRLAGFAFNDTQRGPAVLTAQQQRSVVGTLPVRLSAITGASRPPGGLTTWQAIGPGWVNLDRSPADLAAAKPSATIGSGKDGSSAAWVIKTAVGLAGQCYTGEAGPSVAPAAFWGKPTVCLPPGAAPGGIDLTAVPFPASVRPRLAGYAGVVSGQVAYATLATTDGGSQKLLPVTVSGRRYLAFVLRQGTRLAALTLADAGGRVLARITSLPPPR